MKKALAVLMMIMICFGASGCGAATGEPSEKVEFFAMDTIISLTIYGEGAADALSTFEKETMRLDRLLSAFDETSDVFKINAAGGKAVAISEETAQLIHRAKDASRFTDGAFDITIAPVVSAWGFGESSQNVPAQSEMEVLLEKVGYENIDIGGGNVTLSNGASIDLGAIAKGFAAEKLAEKLSQHGIKSAVFSLGGNVQTLGTRPDGKPWRVAIADPKSPYEYAAAVDVDGTMAVVTSGGYQRFFEQDSKKYHHIIDPKTGVPAQSGLLSVTVICKDAALADAFSTAFFVVGIDAALEMMELYDEPIEAVFITEDDDLLYTAGLLGKISRVGGDYSAVLADGE